ncbi:hypothetical protein AZZ62_003033, partial [Klebsiella variicola]
AQRRRRRRYSASEWVCGHTFPLPCRKSARLSAARPG